MVPDFTGYIGPGSNRDGVEEMRRRNGSSKLVGQQDGTRLSPENMNYFRDEVTVEEFSGRD